MTSASSVDSLQSSLGYRFKALALLDEALTHSSLVNEQKAGSVQHNERLEFLGDAVLSLVMSEYLASALPHSSEGTLSKLKAQVVSESSLAQIARRLGLGEHLKLGRGEDRSKGREKDSLLADALEAVLAAVHLDGGFEASRTVTRHIFSEELANIATQQGQPGAGDYKTQFQEWCQKRHDTLPRYETVRETGPDHQKMFEVELSIQGEVVGMGSGRSKKEAEQQAAKQALRQRGA
ncbi:MAG: ribonuclease III [Nitrospiraceae bacterium]|nr:MAG: ribonuclease III [Nitrospiraceae bacterium]